VVAGKGTGRSVRRVLEGRKAGGDARGGATLWRNNAPGVLFCAVNLRLVRLAGGVHVPDVERRARGVQVTAGAALANLALGHGGTEGMRACVWTERDPSLPPHPFFRAPSAR
jgi:hypothetical protein